MVINRAKFDVCAAGSYEGVKTNRHSDRNEYISLAGFAGVTGRDPPSVMSGFSVSVQLASPASPIGLSCEQ